MRKIRNTVAAVMAAVFVFLGAACGKDQTSPIAAPTQAEDVLTIGLSFDSYVIERWTRDRDVFCATANELGAEVNVQSALDTVSTNGLMTLVRIKWIGGMPNATNQTVVAGLE